MPKLGDFFRTAPRMRPVNPKPITFTAVCKDTDTLPGGVPNNAKKQVATVVDACLVFLGADAVAEARRDARRHIAEQDFDPKAKVALGLDEEAVDREMQKQMLWRALRELDDGLAGEPQFPTVKALREMVEQSECNRLMAAYDAYVKEEHPEVIDTATFRRAEG